MASEDKLEFEPVVKLEEVEVKTLEEEEDALFTMYFVFIPFYITRNRRVENFHSFFSTIFFLYYFFYLH